MPGPFYSTERVERDGYLVYAEGAEIPAEDLDELHRQGLVPKGQSVEDVTYQSTERVERDGVLVYAEGDEIPPSDAEELQRQGLVSKREATKLAAEAEVAEAPVVETVSTPAAPAKKPAKRAAKK
jgi:hypothetical protein